MKRFRAGRERRHPNDPSEAHIKAAENAMYAAVCRNRNIMQVESSIIDHVTITVEECAKPSQPHNPLDTLGITRIDDFESNFRTNGLDCMTTVYETIHEIEASPMNGSLSTGLPEDLFHLVDSQLDLLDEFVRAKRLWDTPKGDRLVIESVLNVLQDLSYCHKSYWHAFLQDIESCVATANDSMRMTEKLEEMMARNRRIYTHLAWRDGDWNSVVTKAIRQEEAKLATQFSEHAVFAAQRAVNFIMYSLRTSNISTDLFGRQWEDELVYNEIALSSVKTFEDYMSDLENFFAYDFLLYKMISSLARATVCFYVRCFVQKAEKLRVAMKRDFGIKRSDKYTFLNPRRASTRMTYDVQIFRDYFRSLAKDSPTLLRLVSEEISVLDLFLCVCELAAGRNDCASLEEYAIIVCKKIAETDQTVTRCFLSDVWLLMGPLDENQDVEEEVMKMKSKLTIVSDLPQGIAATRTTGDHPSSEVSLSQMLQSFYMDRSLQEQSVCATLIREARIGIKGVKDKAAKNRRWRHRFKSRKASANENPARDMSSLFLKL